MTASPRDQLVATNRLRRALLAFQSAQILVLTYQRQQKALSEAGLETVQDSAAEVAAAFQAFSAAGLVPGADDQRLLAQAQRYLAGGATCTPADSKVASRRQRMEAARRERRLEAARRAYRERFDADAPVMPSDLDNPRLPDLLMEAVEAVKPLTAEALAKGLGPDNGRWSRP